ncbi:MAG: S-adenosylmethionine:tRNA ribosyltransferase-isomerase [Bacteroidota bacterium]
MSFPDIKIEEYDYNLPDERIAYFPLKKRDDSKLLFYNKGEIIHQSFKNIGELLPQDSLLILNDTKVIPARIHLQKDSGSTIEIFLLRPQVLEDIGKTIQGARNEIIFEALIGNKKRWKSGEVLNKRIQIKNKEIEVEFVWENREENRIKIHWSGRDSFSEILEVLGNIPLPPYIHRNPDESDLDRYQTIFSKELGAVAAPTASLHFTQEVFEDLKQRGIEKKTLTLHVGAGTFLPVKVENLKDHPMHREQIIVGKEFLSSLIENKRPIIPVGTTALRAIESIYWAGVNLVLKKKDWDGIFILPKEFSYENSQFGISNLQAIQAILYYLEEKGHDQWVMETELLIGPGYDFHFCSGLVTNFHQPKSTLLVLIAGLVGKDWERIYQEAIKGDYRFLSYGDSSLLLKN